MPTAEEFASKVQLLLQAGEAFVATTIARLADEQGGDSVVAILDGADAGARSLYDELRRLAPTAFAEELPQADVATPIVAPYLRLKEAAARAGYALGAQFDAVPPTPWIRVAVFTLAGAHVTTMRNQASTLGRA